GARIRAQLRGERLQALRIAGEAQDDLVARLQGLAGAVSADASWTDDADSHVVASSRVAGARAWMTRTPLRGTCVMPRRSMRSGRGSVAASSVRARIRRVTTRISWRAKLAPRQRRVPPPNGIHVYVSGASSPRNRSGRKSSGAR